MLQSNIPSSVSILQQPSIADQIVEQARLEGAPKSSFFPIRTPVVAKAHTAIYRMHRFFARRPHNVFENLIKHYSNPGDIILDPFCGGGVTVVEGLRARRKVIGIDINPIAALITQMEITPISLQELETAKQEIDKAVREEILRLYETICPECGANAIADWIERSYVVNCPACHQPVNLGLAKKVGPAKFQCSTERCIATFKIEDCKRIGQVMTRIKYNCRTCNSHGEKQPDANDNKLDEQIKNKFQKLNSRGMLNYPKVEIPLAWKIDKWGVRDRGFTHFYKFFTARNLLALSLLKKAISSYVTEPLLRQAMLLVFTSGLYECACYLCHVKDGSVVKAGHHFWMPDVFVSNNVWQHFLRRYKTVALGLEEVNNALGGFSKPATSFLDIRNNATAFIITASSQAMPLPDGSVDVIITDPPFGANVQYSELTNFWTVWLNELPGLENGVMDNTNEVVVNPLLDKSVDVYESSLTQIFKECHRVLRPDGWMVMTFHNRDLAVWMALQRAANKAGFKLPSEKEDPNRGMLYQPPIEQYVTTLHQQPAGAMLGDFVLSFKRQENQPLLESILEALNPDEEELLRQRTQDLIEFHGGADENLLMTGLLPYLQERNLLHRLRRFDFRRFFNSHFTYDKVQKKWFNEQHLDSEGRPLTIIDYVPAQQLTEQLIVDHLYRHKYATLDDLLAVVYSTLVNSHRPGAETVYKTLSRLCDKTKLPSSKRQVYMLKKKTSRSRLNNMPITLQAQLFSAESAIVENLTHNEIIELLAKYLMDMGYQVHVGETEQRKEKHLKEISALMLSNVEFGIPLSTFDTIKEIDLLAIKDHIILAAFEVATTVATANKAINDRYRNLFAAFPMWTPKANIVVNSRDYEAAKAQLLSLANEKQHLSQKVRILKVSQLSRHTVQAIVGDAASTAAKG